MRLAFCHNAYEMNRNGNSASCISEVRRIRFPWRPAEVTLIRWSYQTIWGPLSRMLYDILDDDHIHRYGYLIKQYEVPLSRMLYDILDDDHIRRYGILSNNMRSPSPECYTTFLMMTIYVGTGSYQTLWGSPLPNVIRHSWWWPYTSVRDLIKHYEVLLSRMLHDILDDDHIQWHPPLVRLYAIFTLLLIWTLLPNLTFYLTRVQRVQHANRGRLLIPIPGHVPCGTCKCSCVETNLSWMCLVSGFLSFKHPSVLLVCLQHEALLETGKITNLNSIFSRTVGRTGLNILTCILYQKVKSNNICKTYIIVKEAFLCDT